MTIKDIGPTPQSFDIEDATKDNTDYRSVAWSGRYLQLTLMSIPVGGDIGLEAHPETDQFLRLDAGRGRTQMGPAKDVTSFQCLADTYRATCALSTRRHRPVTCHIADLGLSMLASNMLVEPC